MAAELRAIALLLVAIGFITVVDTTAKALTERLHPLHITWGYFLGIALTLGLYAAAMRRHELPRLLRTARLPLQLGRSAFLVASIGCLFVGLVHMPIADATAISFTAPLFVTALAMPLLGERVGVHRWAAVGAGLLGVLVIVRPGSGLAHWAALMPLIGAVFFALYQLTTRVLATTEPTFRTLLYTGGGGLFWCSLLAPFVWTAPSPAEWLTFVGIGVLGAAAHLCMITAFNLAEASLLAPFNYSKIVWAVIAGYLVWGDVPSLNTLTGGAIIVAAGLYVLWRERRRIAMPA